MSVSQLLLLFLTCFTTLAANRTLSIMLMHLENAQGVVENGTACSPFAFAGVQCSMEMTVCVDIGAPTDNVSNHSLNEVPDGNSTNFTTCYSLGQVTAGSNKMDFLVGTYGEWTNPLVIPLNNTYYEGFRLHVTLTEISGEPIDEWTASFANASQLQDTFTYTSHREGLLGTSLTVAWTTNEVLPPTPPPTTVSTTTVSTTTTPQGDVPYPKTCDEFKDRTDQVKTIYINNKTVEVYCQYGTTGAYTVIQSRGSNDDTSFDHTVDEYKQPFGIPGKGNNFWLGLDNMVALTSQGNYDLLIEVCCGGTNSIQFYRNFTVSKDYVLSAVADVPSVGLDFQSSNTAKKDIGVPFTTYDDMTDNFKDVCDIVRYYGEDTQPLFNAQTGGWWFGSCGNNLNGKFVKNTGSPDCHLDESFSSEDSTSGIEMRTTPGMYKVNTTSGYDLRSFDGISYDRVRMAIFRSGKTPVATNPFC
ncbi:hypothetical protein V3C99_010056, partial [Haemonchus contortus]